MASTKEQQALREAVADVIDEWDDNGCITRLNSYDRVRMRALRAAHEALGAYGSPDVAGLESAKNAAYGERDRLVCALSKVFPSWLARHPDADASWEDDWRWIVFVQLPTGQASWHIHDSEREWFDHLSVGENSWDGHTNEVKYQRLANLPAAPATIDDLPESLRDPGAVLNDTGAKQRLLDRLAAMPPGRIEKLPAAAPSEPEPVAVPPALEDFASRALTNATTVDRETRPCSLHGWANMVERLARGICDMAKQAREKPAPTDAEREREIEAWENRLRETRFHSTLDAYDQAIEDGKTLMRSRPAPEPLDVGNLVYEGNSVAHWHIKAKAYGDTVNGCAPALEAAGHPVDACASRGGGVAGVARSVKALAAERDDLRKQLEDAQAEIDRLASELDPPVCRLQLPDGRVPGNAREAAEMWHAACQEMWKQRDALQAAGNARAVEELRVILEHVEAQGSTMTSVAFTLRERIDEIAALKTEPQPKQPIPLILTPEDMGAELQREPIGGHLVDCLKAFARINSARESWYGVRQAPGMSSEQPEDAGGGEDVFSRYAEYLRCVREQKLSEAPEEAIAELIRRVRKLEAKQ